MWGIKVLKACVDCQEIFNAYSGQEKRCKDCQKAYRKKYHKRYKSDKPKSAVSAYYQYWKFIETLIDEELQALYQVRRQKLKYEWDWEARQKIKTEMKIITDVYKKRIGDREIRKGEEISKDDDRFHREMMDY